MASGARCSRLSPCLPGKRTPSQQRNGYSVGYLESEGAWWEEGFPPSMCSAMGMSRVLLARQMLCPVRLGGKQAVFKLKANSSASAHHPCKAELPLLLNLHRC